MNRTLIVAILFACFLPGSSLAETKWIITQTGSASVPSDALTSIALAHMQGAGTIELNVAASHDGEVVLLRDPVITGVTDVEQQFPDRKRADGEWYAADFTYSELRQLSLTVSDSAGASSGGTPYPLPTFSIARFDDALGLIRTLDTTHDAVTRLMVIPRKNWIYREIDKDLSILTLKVLARFGYTSGDEVLLGSYDPDELRRIKDQVLDEVASNPVLLQLVDEPGGNEHLDSEQTHPGPYDYDWMFTKFGLKALSSYADGIGLPPSQIQPPSEGGPRNNYLEDARLLGLKRLFYPSGSIGSRAAGAEDMVEQLLFETGLDGLATHDAIVAQTYVEQREQEASKSSNKQRSIEQIIEDIRSSDPARNTPLAPGNP